MIYLMNHHYLQIHLHHFRPLHLTHRWCSTHGFRHHQCLHHPVLYFNPKSAHHLLLCMCLLLLPLHASIHLAGVSPGTLFPPSDPHGTHWTEQIPPTAMQSSQNLPLALFLLISLRVHFVHLQHPQLQSTILHLRRCEMMMVGSAICHL